MRQPIQQLLIVQKYETFINYFYPVAQNLPREHGTVKQMFTTDMLAQVELFIAAGRSNQRSKLYIADAGLDQLRFWLRFMSHDDRKIITLRQHQVGEIHLAEVGKILGSWIAKSKEDSGKV